MLNKEEILLLIEKYNQGNCTQQETDLLETWYTSYGELFQTELTELKIESDLEDIFQKLPGTHKKIRLWPRFAAAASIILALSAGGYFVWHKPKAAEQVAYHQHVNNDALPGINKATLTLSNGQKIVLDSTLSGQLAEQGNTVIRKSAGGSIVYKGTATTGDQVLLYNTLTTHNGEEYPLVLSDGTKVWLNAASSITYPAAFNSKERRVAITGEIYFEVEHDATRPFKVEVNHQTIEDLGTRFNVNAYADEPDNRTTLLEGGIRIGGKGQVITLRPGQQAVTKADGKITVRPANTEEVIAWKNGLFHFRHADLKTVMRQLSRWYDLEIVYDGKLPQTDINGEVYRSMKASEVLAVLSNMNVTFRIHGNKIVITDH